MKRLLIGCGALMGAWVLVAAENPSAPKPISVAGEMEMAEGLEGVPVRNPFWPIGYEGKREIISSEVRFVPKKIVEPVKEEPKVETAADAAARAAEEAAAKAAAEEAARKAREITPRHWGAARAELRMGGRLRVRMDDGTERSCAMINGNTYADGDLISYTKDKVRFTWRVKGLTEDDTLKLIRVKARRLDEKENGSSKMGADTSAEGENE